MGYLYLDPSAATYLFQLVSERDEMSSIILTSNKNYGDWGSIFADNVIASAILDRCSTIPSTSRAKATGSRTRKGRHDCHKATRQGRDPTLLTNSRVLMRLRAPPKPA